jgi:O-phosphoseryl-tRNA(Cys) synthetase
VVAPYRLSERCGQNRINQTKYLDCPLNYIGQTGGTFSIRYKEHVHAIRNKSSNSGYANYTVSTGHTHGAILDTMDIVRTGNTRISFIESVNKAYK